MPRLHRIPLKTDSIRWSAALGAKLSLFNFRVFN